MLAGREAALLASQIIDDPVLPSNSLDQQGRLALSVTAHSTAFRCPSTGLDFPIWFFMEDLEPSARLLAPMTP